jgi:diguanylate cyclase (GGDEF)-like protein
MRVLKFLRACACLGSLLFVAAPVFALDPSVAVSQYPVRRWVTNSSVQALAQTPDGYLWVGTQQALARTDGVRFVHFDPTNTPELRSGFIRALAVDRGGVLWIGTAKGVVKRMGSRFIRVELPGVPDAEVLSIAETGRGLMVGTTRGLFVVGGAGIRRFTTADGLPADDVCAIAVDGDRVWLGTSRGLAIREGSGRIRAPRAPGFPATAIHDVAPNGDGTAWIAFQEGAMQVAIDPVPRVVEPRTITRTAVTSILRDASGNVWFGAFAGLYRRAASSPHAVERVSQVEGQVWSLLEDREQNLWLGTYAHGLGRLHDTPFVRYGAKEGLADVILTILTARDGSTWFGSDVGAFRRAADGTITRVTTAQGLPNGTVWSLAEAADGAIWLGTFGGGTVRIAAGKLTRIGVAEGLRSGVVISLAPDDRGGMYIGTGGGGVTHWTRHAVRHYGVAEGLPSDRVVSVTRARAGGVWIGTSGGPLVLLRDGRITAPLPNDPRLRSVRSVVEDPDGTLWLGTFESGLFHVHRGVVKQFRAAEGLSASVMPLLDDQRGSLWFGSDLGIVRVSKYDLRALADGRRRELPRSVYDSDRGASAITGGQPGAARSSGGVLWFPTAEGAAMFDPRRARWHAATPIAAIEELNADGGPSSGPTNSLPPKTRRVDFRFSGLSLTVPEHIEFRYRLEGFDREWTRAEQRTVSYTNLPPGRYRFLVSARNPDGAWGTAAALPIERRPAVHEMTLFRGGVLAVLAALLFGVYRVRLRRLRRRALHLEKVVGERTMLLERANESLRRLSMTDGLTGIANRRHFDEVLGTEWRRGRRHDRPLAVLLIDVDFFKPYNDTYGHQAGDACLQRVAESAQSAIARAGDLIARYGGEEFAVVLPATDVDGARLIAESIRRRVAAAEIPHTGSRVAAHVSVSIGVGVMVPADAVGPEEVVARADRALYRAKERGRNRVVADLPAVVRAA